MRPSKRHVLVAAAATLALVVGVGTAIAATGGSDLKQEAARLAARSTFDTSVATSLGTTTTKLNAAIKCCRVDRIDTAVTAGDITAAEAETLKQALPTAASRRSARTGSRRCERARHHRCEAECRL